jgi:hypothetical protein
MAFTIPDGTDIIQSQSPDNLMAVVMVEICKSINEREDISSTTKTKFYYDVDEDPKSNITIADFIGVVIPVIKLNIPIMRDALEGLAELGRFTRIANTEAISIIGTPFNFYEDIEEVFEDIGGSEQEWHLSWVSGALVKSDLRIFTQMHDVLQQYRVFSFIFEQGSGLTNVTPQYTQFDSSSSYELAWDTARAASRTTLITNPTANCSWTVSRLSGTPGSHIANLINDFDTTYDPTYWLEEDDEVKGYRMTYAAYCDGDGNFGGSGNGWRYEDNTLGNGGNGNSFLVNDKPVEDAHKVVFTDNLPYGFSSTKNELTLTIELGISAVPGLEAPPLDVITEWETAADSSRLYGGTGAELEIVEIVAIIEDRFTYG